ncbi:DUF3365 domain-containing protein [Candidatus Sumerlaeota bacterium]|nr:DUF3365 domain-containing protein [Candidatus Sumerlaeota bacterium]
MTKLSHIQKYLLFGGVLLILILLLAFWIVFTRQEKLIRCQLHSSAESIFENIVLTRLWNANYGGVYVLKKPGEESNPYLKDSDIQTIDGKIYTLKNPALMTREISEHAQQQDKFAYHITSLKLINPANAPDEWERNALMSFEQGVAEMTQITTRNKRPLYRLMRPLRYETSCIRCHAWQGYKLGDVRGGISITLPYEQTAAMLHTNRLAMITLAIAVLLILGLVLYFFVWRLMNRLSAQNVELAELNQQKNEFFGILAHDLRNPLTVILGYTQFLLQEIKGRLNEEQIKLISSIKKNSDFIQRLIDDFLDISKIEAGKLELDLQETDLLALINRAVELNNVLAEKKQIKIFFDYDERLPKMRIDELKIEQVLNNLLSNAIKFSYPNSSVYVHLTRDDNNAIISVKDEGQGIPAGELNKLFKPFEKISVKSTDGERSTGLGLAIVRKIVQGHNGNIWVESEPGKGSTFYVSLPIMK